MTRTQMNASVSFIDESPSQSVGLVEGFKLKPTNGEGMNTNKNSFKRVIRLALGTVLLVRADGAYVERAQSHSNYSEVEQLMTRWIEAYRGRDASRLAELEAPNVEIVDRFGKLHLPSKRKEVEALWKSSFEPIATDAKPPEVIIRRIRLFQTNVALVNVTFGFPDGIILTDGGKVPPFWEVDSYLLTKRQNRWLIVAHIMQDKTS